MTSQTIDVSILGDTAVEPDETFTVMLQAPINATLGRATATGTITNDDTAVTGTQTPVVWTSLVGVSANGNSLTKTAAASWGNAGAASTQSLASGDGYVEFSASETTTFRMLGLSNGDSNQNYTDIDYAIYPATGGTLYVYEKGLSRGAFGSYVTGDILRVAVEGGVVRYRRNGTLLYTSATPPVYPLLVDSALYTQGATLYNAMLGGTWVTGPVPALSIADVSVAEGNAGTTTAAFAVTLSVATTQTVTVGYATADGTASVGSDYSAATGTLTFPPGVTSQAINVSVTGDTTVEPNETFTVTLSAPANAVLGRAVATGTITNDDSISPGPQTPVVWTSLVGVSASGNSLTKTAASSWGNGGAVSAQSLASGDGYVEFTASETTTYRMLGLSNGDTDQNYQDVDYAMYPGPAGALYVYEKGVYRGVFGNYVTGDLLRVAVEGGVVRYRRNGTLVYQSTAAPVYPLLVDTALYSQGATLNNAMLGGTWVTGPMPALSIADVSVAEGNSGTANAAFAVTLSVASTQTVTVGYATANGSATAPGDYTAQSGTLTFAPGVTSQAINVSVLGDTTVEPDETFGVTLSAPTNATLGRAAATGTIVNDDSVAPGTLPVVWTSLVGVSANGNSLTKTAASSWGNAGAISTQVLAAGDGLVEFIASETSTFRMLGLSRGDSDQNYADVDYAMYPATGGVLYVYEKGVSRGTFGSYAPGDVLRVAVEGGVVRYRRNGTLLYTSTTAPVYPLLVDTALYTQGATLNNAGLGGDWH